LAHLGSRASPILGDVESSLNRFPPVDLDLLHWAKRRSADCQSSRVTGVDAGTRHGCAKRCRGQVSGGNKGFGSNQGSKFKEEFFHGKQ
jgi:hypothetical protein